MEVGWWVTVWRWMLYGGRMVGDCVEVEDR